MKKYLPTARSESSFDNDGETDFTAMRFWAQIIPKKVGVASYVVT